MRTCVYVCLCVGGFACDRCRCFRRRFLFVREDTLSRDSNKSCCNDFSSFQIASHVVDRYRKRVKYTIQVYLIMRKCLKGPYVLENYVIPPILRQKVT